jgi:transcriptional regulator with XRE-family HTH domain
MQAKTLKERRLAMGLTQEAISRLMDVSLFTWSRWERQNSIPKNRDRVRLDQVENSHKKA